MAEIGFDPINDVYNAACYVAVCVPLAEKDLKLRMEQRKDLAKQYADQAMLLLRQAVIKGFKDAEHMKKDDDLAPLRSRKDFQELIAELEKKAAGNTEKK